MALGWLIFKFIISVLIVGLASWRAAIRTAGPARLMLILRYSENWDRSDQEFLIFDFVWKCDIFSVFENMYAFGFASFVFVLVYVLHLSFSF